MGIHEKIDWKKGFELGNSMIDQDHKVLIEIYNRVVDIAADNKSNSLIVSTLTELTNYSLRHFKSEENWMKEINYPDFDSHQMEHKDFIYRIAMFNLSFNSSDKSMIYEILTFLREWIVIHLTTSDKKIALYFSETIKN